MPDAYAMCFAASLWTQLDTNKRDSASEKMATCRKEMDMTKLGSLSFRASVRQR